MKRKHVIAALMAAGAAMGSWTFSNYLVSTDTTLKGYLTGMTLNLIGGEVHKLIRVNLYDKSLNLYENGKLVRHAKIAGSGNPNDRTATPVGNYRILSKEPRHVSSLSGVIMPLSLRFFGGYYFHDIPLTPGGVLITTKYSHGCIRLSHDLASEVYQWATVGTYVEVYRARLVRAPDSATVYLLTEDGVRKPIASLAAFQNHGYRWDEVAVVPSSELSQLPLGIAVE